MSMNRKAAIAAYKERKTIAGIYVIRCGASGMVWVGQAPNLETIQNRIWFTLRQGGHPCRSLQAAWNAHGEAGLTFGECERLEDEESAYVRNALLKERVLHWRDEMKAEVI
ncbi:GIY-YIG nuclease family protein [Bradyrhizobium arachidis]|uniref:GIY-YIG nuclease family protein n=1 Tax=Bradyrhizobium TaxID=374 RepID=UPI002163B936|nr:MULTISPECIES: GIY-YIG nuclease family protein [Bradyrhizobium]MDN4988029.1 GIY-YIG nuclease family protein [Bradyrhizobium sp. WYCCWR 13022]UVO35292.1 GIY-YIG nuclease family protein [Bradyrhizobium arachidis]